MKFFFSLILICLVSAAQAADAPAAHPGGVLRLDLAPVLRIT